jgi:hypothetical protein
VRTSLLVAWWGLFYLARRARSVRRGRAFSVGDPVAVKSVRHALWKLHTGNGLALKVRRIDFYGLKDEIFKFLAIR